MWNPARFLAASAAGLLLSSPARSHHSNSAFEVEKIMRTYRRAAPGNDELREAACPEGLDRAK